MDQIGTEKRHGGLNFDELAAAYDELRAAPAQVDADTLRAVAKVFYNTLVADGSVSITAKRADVRAEVEEAMLHLRHALLKSPPYLESLQIATPEALTPMESNRHRP